MYLVTAARVRELKPVSIAVNLIIDEAEVTVVKKT